LQATHTHRASFVQKFLELKQLYYRLPLAERQKKQWLENKRKQKLFCIAAVNNPAIKEIVLAEVSHSPSKQLTINLGREIQGIETLVFNLESMCLQEKKTFVSYVKIGKQNAEKTVTSGALDLFSSAESTMEQYSNFTELKVLHSLEKEAAINVDKMEEALTWSYKLFQELFLATGYKKYACLFLDFVLQKDAHLINFPFALLKAQESMEKTRMQTFVGKRSSAIELTDVPLSKIEEMLESILEENINELKRFYRDTISYEEMPVEQKVRINYIFENSFHLPLVEDHGFSSEHELYKMLCIQGGIKKQDLQKEGVLLFAELLENIRFLQKTNTEDFVWLINVGYGIVNPLKKHNTLLLKSFISNKRYNVSVFNHTNKEENKTEAPLQGKALAS
jgi:hypothetical protein